MTDQVSTLPFQFVALFIRILWSTATSFFDRSQGVVVHLQLLASAWRFGFLAKKNFGFLRFLAKILAIILVKIGKILQEFSK